MAKAYRCATVTIPTRRLSVAPDGNTAGERQTVCAGHGTELER